MDEAILKQSCIKFRFALKNFFLQKIKIKINIIFNFKKVVIKIQNKEIRNKIKIK